MGDEIITCRQCGRPFTWSSGNQQYYREHGLVRPKDCSDCRAQRKGAQRSGMHGNSPLPDMPAPLRNPTAVRGDVRGGRPRQAEQPVWRFSIIALAAGVMLALIFAMGLALDGLAAWLLSINLVALFMYGYDKSVAGSKAMRVPEKVLWLLALVGGTVGALAGMWLFHHKTSKGKFQLVFWAIVVVQVILIVVVYTLGQ